MTGRYAVSTTYTVGQVADLLGITVRTLHHYDQIGLLVPSERSAAGYRLYTDEDLVRLQQIVVYRRLEMPLDEIAVVLENGDVPTHLRRQRAAVMARLDELHGLVSAIDNALEKTMTDQPMTPEDMKQLFGDEFEEHQGEAEQRWGETDAWRQSQERSKHYGRAEWEQIKVEGEDLMQRQADTFRSGAAPTDEAAMDLVEEHRTYMNRWFFDCPPSMHRCVGDLYVQDPRFTETYDGSFEAPGLAQWVREAIHANADRVTGRSASGA